VLATHVVPSLESAGTDLRCALLPRSDGVAATAVGTEAGLELDDPATWPSAAAGVRRIVVADLLLDVELRHALVDFLAWSSGHGVRHVLCCSVAGASPGMVQHRIEEQLLAAGPPCTVLRPTPYFQLLETDYWAGIVTENRLAMPWGAGRIAWVDARDVAEVVTRMVTRAVPPDPGVLTLTGPQPLGGADIAAALTRELGRPVEFEAMSVADFRRFLLDRGIGPVAVHTEMVQNVIQRVSLSGRTDPAHARQLGRAPTSLADYVRDHRHRWSPIARPDSPDPSPPRGEAGPSGPP
jgi:uncharacterized protein YbjT (DUF2867 family)